MKAKDRPRLGCLRGLHIITVRFKAQAKADNLEQHSQVAASQMLPRRECPCLNHIAVLMVSSGPLAAVPSLLLQLVESQNWGHIIHKR